ncbi:MAG: PA14 domain-containing protein [Chloroflexi bacterium]|nr:PA14 domain-containing protein [Chloroflexota bacterium]
MRRIILLLMALGIAVYAQHLLANPDNFAPYVLRDGLILFAIAALVFACNASFWPQAGDASLASERRSEISTILVATGLICAFAGGLGTIFIGRGVDHLPSLILWGLGFVLLILGAWWPGVTSLYQRPAYRWQKDAAGKFVRMALGNRDIEQNDIEQNATATPADANRWISSFLWLLILIGIAAFLRLWQLTSLPADCIDAECVRALALVDGSAGVSLFNLLARALFTLSGQSLLSLRLTSALFGIATVPALYWAARPITRGGARLAISLLALSPWHIWASRSSDPWIVTPLLLCLAIWATFQAIPQRDRRWWILAGLGFGLTMVTTPALQWPMALWVLLIFGLVTVLDPRAIIHNALLPLATLAVALPGLLRAFEAETLWPSTDNRPPFAAITNELLTNLLHQSSGSTVSLFSNSALLDGLTVALAILGIGALLRHLRRPAAGLLISGGVLVALALTRIDLVKTPAASFLLALLPFFLLSAAVALDQLLYAFQQTWRPVIKPARMAVAALMLILLIGGRHTLAFTRHLQAVTSGAQSSTDVAIGRFLAQQLHAAPANTLFFAPATVLANPATRLLAGSALESGVVRPLDTALDFVLAGAASNHLRYLVPLADQELLRLLQQIYPNSPLQPQLDEQSGELRFMVLDVPESTVTKSQGLLMLSFTGNDFDDVANAQAIETTGPLAFDWQDRRAMQTPFSVQWQGTLLIPAAGNYTFSVQTEPAQQAIFSLRLDNMIVLDTSLGATEKQQTLAKGFYRLTMSYRSGVAPSVQPPSALIVRWQRPGGALEVIPRNVLHQPALPNNGLLGTYYAGNQWQGPALDQHKDLLIGLPVDLPQPYSVQWQGKLAAPRAGEYMLATLGQGVNQLSIDDQVLIDNQQSTPEKTDRAYTEGIIYLTQGWHTIDVQHAPDSTLPNIAAGLQLLWQPPGSASAPLTNDYLAPVIADVAPGDLALPAPPPLVGGSLGDHAFALAQSIDLWKPQVRIPPANLAPLRFSSIWQVGNSCGNGAGQFNQPHGVAIDPVHQLLYVADTANQRVLQLKWDGTINASYQSPLFQEPFDVEMGSDNAVLVLDTTAQQILHINPTSGEIQPLPLETSFYHPRGFTVDSAGNLAVADTGGGRVVILSATGQVLGEFGGQNSLLAAGQPVDALAVKGALWAVTAEDGRLWQLISNGSLTALPRTDTLNGPHLAGLPDNSFFLSDPMRKTIGYYASTGQPLGQFAFQGAFTTPTGIAATPLDNFVYLAVSDSATCSLSLWRIANTELPK